MGVPASSQPSTPCLLQWELQGGYAIINLLPMREYNSPITDTVNLESFILQVPTACLLHGDPWSCQGERRPCPDSKDRLQFRF